MKKEKKPGSDKFSNLSEEEKKNLEQAVKSATDRSDDPLFVPDIKALRKSKPEGFQGVGASEDGAAGPDDLAEYSDLLESICGVSDDSQAVEQYNGTLGVTTAFVASHQAHACQVQWNGNLSTIYTNPGNVSGVRWGTGTMISNDLFLTCGHLFDQTGGGWERPRQNGTSNIISPQEIATNMRLNFNYQVDPSGVLRAAQSFPIIQLIEYRLGGVDMAVCRIGGNPGTTFGHATVSTTDAAVGNMICIIGHPAGQPKRIEAGPTTVLSGNLINYNDIDTLGGNSGSGILRASDGRLVGVHTNGGCGPASPGVGGGSNFGQRITAIINNSPTLRALLTKRKFSDDPIKPVLDNPVTLKFRDDLVVKPTVDKPIRDTPVTLKFRDDGGTKFKARDDVKIPSLDNPGNFQPGRFSRENPAARPFILSTPHHSYAWQTGGQQGPNEQQEIESTLSHYEQAMAKAEEELAQLDREYSELLAYYETLNAGGQQ